MSDLAAQSLQGGALASVSLGQVQIGGVLSAVSNGLTFISSSAQLGSDLIEGELGTMGAFQEFGENNLSTLGSITTQALMKKLKVPGAEEISIGVGAAISTVESAQDDMSSQSSNSDQGMSAGKVRICSGMGAEKGGCQ